MTGTVSGGADRLRPCSWHRPRDLGDSTCGCRVLFTLKLLTVNLAGVQHFLRCTRGTAERTEPQPAIELPAQEYLVSSDSWYASWQKIQRFFIRAPDGFPYMSLTGCFTFS